MHVLTSIALSLALALVPTAAEDPDRDWGIGDIITGNDGSGVTVGGQHENEGGPQIIPIDNGWDPPAPPTPPEDPFERCRDEWDSNRLCFTPGSKPGDEEGVPAIPAITITDLARFAPDGSALAGEPNNVGVVGLPTNFVTTASVQTVAGELFGFPISVRFTPSGYDFDYGDGMTTTTASGGATWADLGQAQFTPTDTSHAYSERGTYTAQVDVRYTAEVDFGIGWFPINGEVTSAGAPQEIRIFEAHTALVAHTCAEAPTSPGC